MLSLYLLSIVLGILIFMILILLDTIVDWRANIWARKRLDLGEEPDSYAWQDRLHGILQGVQSPDFFHQFVEEKIIVQSGIAWEASSFRALWWLLILLGTSAGAVITVLGRGNLTVSAVGLTILLIPSLGPYLYLQWRVRERDRAVSRELPDFLDLLTLTVEAGLGFIPALRRVSGGTTGILGLELQRVLSQIDLGFTRSEALEGLVYRLPSSDVEHFVEAINLSEKLGTSLARTMRVQANLLRTRRKQRAEVKAQTAPIRIIPALVFFFLPSLLLVYLAPPIINFLLRR